MSVAMDIIRLQEDSKKGIQNSRRVKLRDYLDYNMSAVITIYPIDIKCLGCFWIDNLNENFLDCYVQSTKIDPSSCTHLIKLKENRYTVGEAILKCLMKVNPDNLRQALEVYSGSNVMIYPFKDLISTDYLLEKAAESLLNLKVKALDYDKKQDIVRIDVGFIAR